MSEMSDAPAAAEVEDVDTLGPVDWIVVEFPGARFDGTVLPILVDPGGTRDYPLARHGRTEEGRRWDA